MSDYGSLAHYQLCYGEQIKKMFTITDQPSCLKIHIREWMNCRPTSKGVTIPLQRWVNLLAHMKDIGKSRMKIKNEDDSVDVRYKPSGDLVIGVKSPY